LKQNFAITPFPLSRPIEPTRDFLRRTSFPDDPRIRCIARRARPLPTMPMHHREALCRPPFSGWWVCIKPLPPRGSLHDPIRSHEQRNVRDLGDRFLGKLLCQLVGGIGDNPFYAVFYGRREVVGDLAPA